MYYIMNAVGGLRIIFTVCIILSLCCSIRYSFLSTTIVIASTIDYDDGAAIVVERGLETIPDEPMLKINTNTATRSSSSKTSTISHKPGLKQTINAFGILMLVGVN